MCNDSNSSNKNRMRRPAFKKLPIIALVIGFARCNSAQSERISGPQEKDESPIAYRHDKGAHGIRASVDIQRRTSTECDLVFSLKNNAQQSVFIRAPEMPWNKLMLEDLVIRQDSRWVRPITFLRQEPFSPSGVEEIRPGFQISGSATLCPESKSIYDVSGSVTIELQVGDDNGRRCDFDISFGPFSIGSPANSPSDPKIHGRDSSLPDKASDALDRAEMLLSHNDIDGAFSECRRAEDLISPKAAVGRNQTVIAASRFKKGVHP